MWNVYDGYTPARNITINFDSMTYVRYNQVYITLSVTGGSIDEVTDDMFVGHTFVTDLDNYGLYRFTFTSTSVIQIYYNDGTVYKTSSTRNWSRSGNVIYISGDSSPMDYVIDKNYKMLPLSKTVPAVIGTQIGFITDNDSTAYPNGAVGDDGHYYTLLKSI